MPFTDICKIDKSNWRRLCDITPSWCAQDHNVCLKCALKPIWMHKITFPGIGSTPQTQDPLLWKGRKYGSTNNFLFRAIKFETYFGGCTCVWEGAKLTDKTGLLLLLDLQIFLFWAFAHKPGCVEHIILFIITFLRVYNFMMPTVLRLRMCHVCVRLLSLNDKIWYPFPPYVALRDFGTQTPAMPAVCSSRKMCISQCVIEKLSHHCQVRCPESTGVFSMARRSLKCLQSDSGFFSFSLAIASSPRETQLVVINGHSGNHPLWMIPTKRKKQVPAQKDLHLCQKHNFAMNQKNVIKLIMTFVVLPKRPRFAQESLGSDNFNG